MQSKKQSLTESITNTAVGFCISLGATFVIFPVLGIPSTGLKNVMVTLFFTVISIMRGYMIRRWFNKKAVTVKPPLSPVDQDVFWLHCFNCEIDMPVVEDKEIIYCSNCGLKH